MRRYRNAALLLPFLVVLNGCGGGTSSPAAGPNCNPSVVPDVQLLYPIPQTKGVSTIGLARSYSAVPSGYLSRTAVPNPLPSPAATPGPYGTTLFAVAVPTLRAHARYDVSALEGTNPSCVADPSDGLYNVGSFSTQ
jgi:hypothetical protein